MMNDKKLFNRDIIYILHGMNALKSIKNRLMEYKDNLNINFHCEKHSKRSMYYVPAAETPLIFGFQIEAFPFKLSALTNDSWVTFARPKIKKYFFQFFIPDSLFLKPEYASTLETQLFYYYPISSTDKFEQESTEEKCTEVYYTYPAEYVYPAYTLQYDPFYSSKQRLLNYIGEESKIVSNTSQTLIFNFIEATKPTVKTDKSPLVLADIWNAFKVVSDKGIELFKENNGNRAVMAAYSVSLAGLHLSTSERTIISYIESSPYYTRLPLHNKMEDLAKKYTETSTEEISNLSPKAWLGVLWTPISCIPQLRIQGQFLIFYEFSAVCGCTQLGMLNYNVDDCEFWKDCSKDKATLKVLKEEEKKVKRFFGENYPIA